MNLHGHDIAVCSWSLRPTSMADLVEQVKRLELGHIQLALAGLVSAEPEQRRAELDVLRRSGLKLTGGMISFSGEDYSSIATIRDTGGFVPDQTWPERKRITLQAAALAAELGCKAITTHIGFVPHQGQTGYDIIVSRIQEIAREFAASGLDLLLETGQEPAAELLMFLNDVAARNVGVNFDPANMILYGAGDPIQAIGVLGTRIRHVHVKDATASAAPGEAWGEEVRFGTGEVDVRRFTAALKTAGYTGPLAIEREAGEERFHDVAAATVALRDAE